MRADHNSDLMEAVVGSDMKAENPVHPGEILEEVLEQHGMNVRILAKELMIPVKRLCTLLDGTQGISADFAIRLAKFFDTPPYYWMVLQNSYDLVIAERNNRDAIGKIVSVDSSGGMATEKNGAFVGADITDHSASSFV